MANREAATRIGKMILKKADPSGKSAGAWVEMVEALSDKQFADYIEQIDNGTAFVPLIYENMTGSAITTEHLINVAEELNIKLFQRLITTDPATGMTYKTRNSYPVMHLPVRRPVQMLREKWSIPENNMHIDESTGQVTGESKASSMSLPETLILMAQGQEMSLQEFLNLRGGDQDAQAAMERRISETGECDATDIMEMGTKTKSTQTLSVRLRSQHFENTL